MSEFNLKYDDLKPKAKEKAQLEWRRHEIGIFHELPQVTDLIKRKMGQLPLSYGKDDWYAGTTFEELGEELRKMYFGLLSIERVESYLRMPEKKFNSFGEWIS